MTRILWIKFGYYRELSWIPVVEPVLNVAPR